MNNSYIKREREAALAQSKANKHWAKVAAMQPQDINNTLSTIEWYNGTTDCDWDKIQPMTVNGVEVNSITELKVASAAWFCREKQKPESFWRRMVRRFGLLSLPPKC